MDRRKGTCETEIREKRHMGSAERTALNQKSKKKAERAIPKKSPPCFFNLVRCYVRNGIRFQF